MIAAVHGDPNIGVVILWAIVAAYFLPTLVAGLVHSKRVTAVFIVNLFLGWTFLGWVAALAWALTP